MNPTIAVCVVVLVPRLHYHSVRSLKQNRGGRGYQSACRDTHIPAETQIGLFRRHAHRRGVLTDTDMYFTPMVTNDGKVTPVPTTVVTH